MELSIILPTYNEAENIPLIIPKIKNALQGISHEIIIADDNSPDKTYEVAEKLGENDLSIRTIRRFHNKGLSPSVLDGFATAKGKYLIVMDADMQHDEKVLPQFLKAFQEGADIVVGTRKNEDGGIENWSLIRRFISWTATLMAKILLTTRVSDPMTGFFGITKKVFHEIGEDIDPKGFKIFLEFLVRSKNKQIKEIGFIFKPRQFGSSKLNSSIIWQYLIGLYDLRLGKIIPRKFIKYGLVGLSGVGVNLGTLYLAKNYLSWSNHSSLILAIEISMITNYFLNNIWTFTENQIKGFVNNIKGIIKFHIFCALGALINFSFSLFLKDKLDINIYFADIVGILIATAWNYILNLKYTWNK